MRSTCSEHVSTVQGYIDMVFDTNRPFNDLPDLPPASGTETKAILQGCIAARVALGGSVSPGISFQTSRC